MKLSLYSLIRVLFALVATLAFQPAVHAASQAQTIVTIETKESQPPTLHTDDVMLYQDRTRVPVTQLTPVAGQPVELYVAVDEATGPNLGPQLNDLQKFITSQPPTTAVGVAYMRDGTVEIFQKPTTDHAAAAKTIRIPAANVGSSSFESITDLLKQWPQSSARRELVVLSSGIEPFGGNEVSNPLVDEAIAAAQRATIPVFVIYTPAVGHFGHTFWRTSWGQTYLSRLEDETGGEGYNLSGLAVNSFGPFLDEITQRIQRQFVVAFTPKPHEKEGFVPIHAKTELPHVELVTPDRVWLGAE